MSHLNHKAKRFDHSDPRSHLVLPLDWRVHFAVNGGCRGGPNLRVFCFKDIDFQLDYSSTSFLKTSKINLDKSEMVLELSELVKFFKNDFCANGDLVQALKKYL